jgi:hypothetical protein
MFAISVKHERTESRHEQHFVRVQDQTIGLFQPLDQMPVSLTETGRATMSRIHVHPDFMLTADVGNLIQRIECSDRSRTRTRHDSHNWVILRSEVAKSFVEPIGVDPATFVKRGTDDLICS